MKVFQIIYTLSPGGAERFVLDLTNELAEKAETSLYVLRDDSIGNQGFYKSELSRKVTYVNLALKPGFNPFIIWKFNRILRTERPDVVHCHLNLVSYFFILSLVFRKKIRFVYTMHSSASYGVGSIEKWIRRFFFKHSFVLPVAISEETKNSYTAFYNLSDIPVIYNGRSTSHKSGEFRNVADEICEIKTTPESLVFCHVARYDLQKNQLMLIKVFNQLLDEGFDLVLLIVGSGFENATELKSIAKPGIHFLGVKTNVPDYLLESHAFCLSSINEGMPISLIEALSCGCIPICTPVGGIINSIKHGETGFISKSVSQEDYLEAVKEFIETRESIDRNTLITYYRENFGIDRCADKYLKLYQRKLL